MKFCILIEISKESIAFLYNRSDSNNGFVPFVGQGPLPLAIYCDGNQMGIGQFAVDEANKQNPKAFVDVFSKMRDGGTFKYRGEEIPSNMLLFNAIQSSLSSFFDSTLIGQMGRLEQNVATMPLCFLFHADVNENERLFVKDSFDRSGFANVGVRDCDQLAMRTIEGSSAYYLCVTSNGQDLFVNVYSHEGKQMDSLIIRDCGRDPRLDLAVDKLWDSIGGFNYNLNRRKEQPILRQLAENFLDSGSYSLNENVTLSDGNVYNVWLSLRELDECRVNDNGKVLTDIMRKLTANQIKPSDCMVILQGKAAHNSFFANIFKQEFVSVRSIDHSLRTEMLATLLDEVKTLDYKIGKSITKNPEVTVPHTPQSSLTSVLPTRRDERDMKVLGVSVETCLANGRKEQAMAEIREFSRKMHDGRVHAFDQELEELLGRVKATEEPVQKSVPSPSSTPTPEPEISSLPVGVPPSKRDERDMKLLGREVAAYIKQGETNRAKCSVDEFRRTMHSKNVHAFDDDLDALLQQTPEKASIGENSEFSPVVSKPQGEHPVLRHPRPKPLPDIDRGVALMREGKFKDAREWFRAQGQLHAADDCTSIIRWLRLLPAYETEVPVTRETHNRYKARARVREIDAMLVLYGKYQIDASPLEKLRCDYRNIK